ncbi:hypothetical protein PATA110616_18920 [Paenibacillus tarimensis]
MSPEAKKKIITFSLITLAYAAFSLQVFGIVSVLVAGFYWKPPLASVLGGCVVMSAYVLSYFLLIPYKINRYLWFAICLLLIGASVYLLSYPFNYCEECYP